MANYYISPTGNDSNDGLSTGTPWLSLSKITSGSFNPGDNIYLEKDGIFNGTLTIPNSGSAGNLIQLSQYGAGSNIPIINSLFTIPSWTSIGSGLYTYTSGSFPSYLKTVKFDGALKGKGRFPKSNFLTISAVAGVADDWVESTSLPAIDYSGAEIVIRKQRFIYHIAEVASVSGDRVYYGPDAFTGTYPAQVGYGFFLQNHVSTLTELGEWMYDSTSQTITMYFGAEDPSTHTIEVGLYENAISLTNRSYLNINSIGIRGFNGSGILGNTVTNSQFSNLDLSFLGNDGIIFSDFSSGNCSISNSLISNVHNSSIYANYTCSNMSVTGCRITNSGIIIGGSGAYGNGDSKNLGICLQLGDNNLIQGNYVFNTGFNGIVNNGNNSLVHQNVVDTFNTMKDDGGGIYYSLGGTGFSLTTQANITENLVVNGMGYALGTNDPSYVVYDIYMDDLQNDVNIEANSCLNSRGGSLYIHNATDIVINNNLFAGAKKQITFSEDSSLEISGITFTNNRVYCTRPDQIYASCYSQDNGFATWGTFNNNDYRHVQNQLGMFEVYGNDTLPYNFGKSFTEWKSIIAGDAASTVDTYETYPPTGYTVLETIFDKTYPDSGSVTSGLGGFSFLDGATATFDSGTALLTKTSAGRRAGYMNFGSVTSGIQYLLTVEAYSNSAPQYISLNTESTYSSAYGLPKSKRLEITSASPTVYECLLEDLTTDASDQLLWLMESTFGNINIVNVKLERLETFTFTQILQLLYNNTEDPVTFNLPYNAQPLPSGTISNSFTLDPMEALPILQLEDGPSTTTTTSSSTTVTTTSTSSSTTTSSTTASPGTTTTTTSNTTLQPPSTTTSTTLQPPSTTTTTSTTSAPVTTTTSTTGAGTTTTTSTQVPASTTSSTTSTSTSSTTTTSTTGVPTPTTTTTSTTKCIKRCTKNIKYKGPRLANLGVEINDQINSIFKKINDILSGIS